MAQHDKKPAPDWERIEVDYRAGLLSLREIAAAHGVSHVAISKHAKRDGWERDLKAKIQAKADSLVTKHEVTKLVTTETAVTDKQVVDANAQVIADIRISHRTDIARSRALTMSLLQELEHQTDNLELFEDLGELMRSPDEKGVDRLNDLYRKVISLGSRTGTMKQLSDSLKTLIGLEREAYGINTDVPPENTTPSGLSHFYGDTDPEADA